MIQVVLKNTALCLVSTKYCNYSL